MTEVDGQDMSKGGIIAQGLEIDEFDEDIGVFFRFWISGYLSPDEYHFLLDDIFLN